MHTVMGQKNNNGIKAYVEVKKIFGIGDSSALYYCGKVGLNKSSSVDKLTRDLWKQILKYISSDRIVDDELRSAVQVNIKKHIKFRSLKGLCFLQGLPVRGQNTKNNSRTARKLNRKSL